MNLIEPCCTQKHWPALRSKIGGGGTTFFHGYGDLSLAELLPVMLSRYSETEMTVITPTLPNTAAMQLKKWLEKQWARQDGRGTINVLHRLTIITDLSKKKSPMAYRWLQDKPYGSRLVLHDIQQNDTAILLPDIAIFGALNFVPNGHFTALVTSSSRVIASLRETYDELIKKSQATHHSHVDDSDSSDSDSSDSDSSDSGIYNETRRPSMVRAGGSDYGDSDSSCRDDGSDVHEVSRPAKPLAECPESTADDSSDSY